MTLDLDELELRAKAATGGEWWLSENDGSICSGPDGPEAVEVGPTDFNSADTAYVLAANPTTVLALIARVRELEAGLGEVCGHVETSWSDLGALSPQDGDVMDADDVALWNEHEKAIGAAVKVLRALAKGER